MVDAARLLHALEPPAALVSGGGVIEANAAFAALPQGAQAAAVAGAADGWRATEVGEGVRLLLAADPRLARRGRMLATLSHEIRTPLNGVLGMAGLLGATPLDATQAAYLATLHASGAHLLSLVEEVLDYARLDAGRVELEPVETDVEQLLQTVCELLSPRAHAAGLEIAWATEGAPPPPVTADDGRLRQVLFNLAGNAVKLTRAGGVLLSVASRPAADGRLTLRFCVRDTGPGLDRPAQARVWEEFEQAEDGARAGGAGLGLAIVRRLADAFDGRLGVESRPGEGALFWFEAEFAPARAAAAHPRLRGVAVEVVSPSPVVAAAAALQVAAEGGRALRLEPGATRLPSGLPSGSPCRPVIDVRLVDGAAAGDLPPPPPGAPALVLLAPEARERIPAARALGYAGWLIKPLRRASVGARIRAVLDGGETPAAGHPASEDERATPAAASGLRVLLAEDNAVNALLARALLQREGCEVERVATGTEAVEAAGAGGFDLVLMDLRMPGLNGLEATAALRAAGVRTPVVALTANAFDDDRRACREAGLDDFLTKPLDPAALRAVLARWASPHGRRAA